MALRGDDIIGVDRDSKNKLLLLKGGVQEPCETLRGGVG